MSFLNADQFNSEDKEKFHPGTGEAFVAQPETVLAGKRCLVVDDELLIALDIEQILGRPARDRHLPASADDAMAALAQRTAFRLAVLDIYCAGRRATSPASPPHFTLQNTPFIFLTGMRGVDLRPGEFPAVPVVEKPCQPAVLVEAVVRAIAAR